MLSQLDFSICKKIFKVLKFLVKLEKQCVKALQILPYFTLKIQNGANQLTSYIVDTYPVYDVAISINIFFCDFLYEYLISPAQIS